MKVICIDGKRNNPDTDYDLPEGVTLEVSQGWYEECFLVKGFERDSKGELTEWGKRRFIPLSSIDETEMVREIEIQVTKT